MEVLESFSDCPVRISEHEGGELGGVDVGENRKTKKLTFKEKRLERFENLRVILAN